MKHSKLTALVIAVLLLTAPASGRVLDINGLAPSWWPQKGGQPIALPVYDVTTSAEWAPIVAEVVAAWNGAPYALTLVKLSPEVAATKPDTFWSQSIYITDAATVQYGGKAWMIADSRGKLNRVGIQVEFADHYLPDETNPHDWHWMLRRVMGHELGNALTLDEVGVHSGLTDLGCIMGSSGVLINTPLDHALLCQRYGCGR